MRKKLQGLLAFWLSLALTLAASPIVASAESGTFDAYLYAGSAAVEPGAYVGKDMSGPRKVLSDTPFDEQENLTGAVSIPDGYELSGWKLWTYDSSGMAGSEPIETGADGTLSEQSHIEKWGEGGRVLIEPVLGEKQDAGDEGSGDDGSAGDEGSGDDGSAGDEGSGDDGSTGDSGSGDDGSTGDEGSGDDGSGGSVSSITLRIGEHSWGSFSGNRIDETFYKEQQYVKIEISQGDSGVRQVQYYLANEDLFPEDRTYQPEEIEGTITYWNGYVIENTNGVDLSSDNLYILYVKVEDNNGKITYANTGHITIDISDTVIRLTGNGEGGRKIKIGDKVTFTVEEAHLKRVLVDDTELQPADGIYSFTVQKEKHVITAEDKAGNSAVEEITAEKKDGDDESSEKPEDHLIASGGRHSLAKGTAYVLGAGKWSLEGDKTLYEGGNTFYVSEKGKYRFFKQ